MRFGGAMRWKSDVARSPSPRVGGMGGADHSAGEAPNPRHLTRRKLAGSQRPAAP